MCTRWSSKKILIYLEEYKKPVCIERLHTLHVWVYIWNSLGGDTHLIILLVLSYSFLLTALPGEQNKSETLVILNLV